MEVRGAWDFTTRNTYKVIELSQSHFRADILTHSDKSNADYGESLKSVILFAPLLFLDMVVTVVEHRLDF